MMVQDEKQMLPCLPDISTLLRVGHFYFALTHRLIFLDRDALRCYHTVGHPASVIMDGQLSPWDGFRKQKTPEVVS